MEEIIFKGASYSIVSQKVAKGAPDERSYIIAVLEEKAYFFKRWTKKTDLGFFEVLVNAHLGIHPYIVQMLDYEVDSNSVTMMFPYYPYENLDQVVKVGGLTPEESKIIVEQLYNVVEYLKSKGLISGSICKWDFGLGNILWCKDDKNILLIDFALNDQEWPEVLEKCVEKIEGGPEGTTP